MHHYPLIVEEKLWKRFKIACAVSEKPMAVQIRELIEKFVNSYQEPKVNE